MIACGPFALTPASQEAPKRLYLNSCPPVYKILHNESLTYCTSFDQHERALGLLEEELMIVRMYLDIEMLRFGSRLKVD